MVKKRGTLPEREAKAQLRKLFVEKPEIRDLKWSLKQAYDWLSKEYPDLVKKLTYSQVQGVYTLLKNPVYRERMLAKYLPEGEKTKLKEEDTKSERPSQKSPEKDKVKPQSTKSPKLGHIDIGKELGGGGEGGSPEEALTLGFERELMVQATPIIRKVILNPKVFLWYDYAKSELGYQGDLGDFINDAIEDFWRSRGYKIKIVQEREIA